MANIKSQILIQMQKFYSWDIKTISQAEIISMGYRSVGDTCYFERVDLLQIYSRKCKTYHLMRYQFDFGHYLLFNGCTDTNKMR